MTVSQTQDFGTLSGPNSLPLMPRIGPVPEFGASCSIPCVEGLILTEEGAPGRRSFRGRIVIPGTNCLFPEQEFIETRTADQFFLSNRPEGKWPSVVIELGRDGPNAPFRCTAMRAQHRDNSAEAWLLLTRFMFCVTSSDAWSIVDDRDTVLKLVPRIDPALALELRHLSSVVRKVSYIGSVFNIDFSIPEALTQVDFLAIEFAFRAISEGEFTVRTNEVTFRKSDLARPNLAKAPFAAPGPLSLRRESGNLSLLGHTVELGPYGISADQAEIANHSLLHDFQNHDDELRDIRFIVYDHQVKYSFDWYAGKKDRKRNAVRVTTFKHKLAQHEPEELANLIDESLQSDVSSFEASQIAMGWLQYNDFPDRYCPQKPILDEDSGKWRVPIHLAYPSGKGGRVGELSIDLKTGVLNSATSIEAVRAEGAALAARLFDAR
jgi:hypothetical protein